MHCKSCSGNEFSKTESGNYKCVYCGTLFLEEPLNIKNRGIYTPRRIITSAFIILIFLGIAAAVSYHLSPGSRVPIKQPDTEEKFVNNSKLSAPAGEVTSVDIIPDSIGNRYFLVMCRNTGTVAIKKPLVIIRLYSKNGFKIASGRGYAFHGNLNPGESTPINVLIKKCPDFSRYETEFVPELPYIIPEGGIFTKKFTGKYHDISLQQVNSFNSHKLRGRIVNKSGREARFVHIGAVLFDNRNHAVGYSTAYISEKKLAPEGDDFFEIYFTSVCGKPEYYRLYSDAIVE